MIVWSIEALPGSRAGFSSANGVPNNTASETTSNETAAGTLAFFIFDLLSTIYGGSLRFKAKPRHLAEIEKTHATSGDPESPPIEHNPPAGS
jgi:hypothetical protein